MDFFKRNALTLNLSNFLMTLLYKLATLFVNFSVSYYLKFLKIRLNLQHLHMYIIPDKVITLS